MIELKLHRKIYEGTAIDQAIKLYAKYATFEQREEPDYWVVGVTSTTPAREQRVAGEVANSALGLTISARKHDGG